MKALSAKLKKEFGSESRQNVYTRLVRILVYKKQVQICHTITAGFQVPICTLTDDNPHRFLYLCFLCIIFCFDWARICILIFTV